MTVLTTTPSVDQFEYTIRQVNYARFLFEGWQQYDAYKEAGYAVNATRNTIDANASRLANSAKVKAKIAWFHAQADEKTITTVRERKQILSEIARGRLTDYQEAGLDGAGYISINKDSPNTAAIAGIESATRFDENGNTGTLFTKVKLHNPVPAIDLLNKMDGAYAPEKIDITEGLEKLLNRLQGRQELAEGVRQSTNE